MLPFNPCVWNVTALYQPWFAFSRKIDNNSKKLVFLPNLTNKPVTKESKHSMTLIVEILITMQLLTPYTSLTLLSY